jgi:hypothetical protein
VARRSSNYPAELVEPLTQLRDHLKAEARQRGWETLQRLVLPDTPAPGGRVDGGRDAQLARWGQERSQKSPCRPFWLCDMHARTSGKQRSVTVTPGAPGTGLSWVWAGQGLAGDDLLSGRSWRAVGEEPHRIYDRIRSILQDGFWNWLEGFARHVQRPRRQ